jgi:hypothetical protein
MIRIVNVILWEMNMILTLLFQIDESTSQKDIVPFQFNLHFGILGSSNPFW